MAEMRLKSSRLVNRLFKKILSSWAPSRGQDQNTQVLATFRVSSEKPPLLQARPLELFYRSRPLRVFLQIVFVVALVFWTVQQYVQVFRSMQF